MKVLNILLNLIKTVMELNSHKQSSTIYILKNSKGKKQTFKFLSIS